MLISVLDTETTGIIRGDYASPDAPYLASVALLIYDTEQQRVQSSLNLMVNPFGQWTMPSEAGNVNGLDTEMLELYGVTLRTVLLPTCRLIEQTSLIVGHNVAFDKKIMAAALYREGMEEQIDMVLNKDSFCTMQQSKNIVQAKTVNGRLKNPRLGEAYQFFFDRPLDNAHAANADVVATLEIYLVLKQLEEEAGSKEGVKL